MDVFHEILGMNVNRTLFLKVLSKLIYIYFYRPRLGIKAIMSEFQVQHAPHQVKRQLASIK